MGRLLHIISLCHLEEAFFYFIPHVYNLSKFEQNHVGSFFKNEPENLRQKDGLEYFNIYQTDLETRIGHGEYESESVEKSKLSLKLTNLLPLE